MTELQPSLGPPAPSPAAATPAHRGWRSRGYLPHCDDATLIQHIVFSLADATPPNAKPPSAMHRDRLLDQGYGECLLRKPERASIVEETLLFADGERYKLVAWCVMPNHVHVIAEQIEGWPLDGVIQAWKSAAGSITYFHVAGDCGDASTLTASCATMTTCRQALPMSKRIL